MYIYSKLSPFIWKQCKTSLQFLPLQQLQCQDYKKKLNPLRSTLDYFIILSAKKYYQTAVRQHEQHQIDHNRHWEYRSNNSLHYFSIYFL